MYKRQAEYWKIEGDELQDLAMCALLHDNALTQYISCLLYTSDTYPYRTDGKV